MNTFVILNTVDLIANSSADAFPADGWFKIGVVGEWKGHPIRPGGYKLTAADLQAIADFHGQRYVANNAQLVVDYDHQSLVAMRQGIIAKAAGWVPDQLELRDGEKDKELWAHIAWNADARALIADRQYRYLSPVFVPNYPDPVTGKTWPWVLNSIALTNRPFLTELPAIVNASDAVAGLDDSKVAQEEKRMELLKSLAAALGMELQAAAQMLGLGADAPDADVLKAVASKLSGAVANSAAAARLPVVANALGIAPDADDDRLKARAAEIAAAQTAVAVVANALGMPPDTAAEKLAGRIGELTATAADTRAEKLVANAVEAGKIPPALKDWWTQKAKADFAGTEPVVNSLPVILPLTRDPKDAAALAGQQTPEEVFANSADLKAEFGDVAAYKAYLTAEKEGRVKVVTRKQE